MNRFIYSKVNMPQISRQKLDKTIATEMFAQFWDSVSQLRTASDASAFFTDLLTPTEEIMLAKRFMIAVLLNRGKKPIEIGSILHVSFSTINGVAAWSKNAKPETKRLLDAMTTAGNWQKLFDKIEATLDLLPPGRGTNWRLAGKEKWQRKQKRLSRQPLY